MNKLEFILKVFIRIKPFILKIFILKAFILKVFILKVFILKAFIFKVFILKVFMLRAFIGSLHKHILINIRIAIISLFTSDRFEGSS